MSRKWRNGVGIVGFAYIFIGARIAVEALPLCRTAWAARIAAQLAFAIDAGSCR